MDMVVWLCAIVSVFIFAEIIMTHRKKNKPNTRRGFTAVSTFQQRAHSNPEDTAEPTAGPSHGQVVGVEGTAVTSRNEPTTSKRRKTSVIIEKTSDASSGNQKPPRKPNFNFSSSKFSDIKTTDHFVDKTRIIEVLFGDSNNVLVTRPRRFGKSTIMNMVKEFVEKKVYTSGKKIGKEIPRTAKNERAFPKMNLLLFNDENLKISKWDKFSDHHGKYPTIYVELQEVQGETYWKILVSFRNAIKEAFSRHSYLLECEDLWATENHPGKFDKKIFVEHLNPTPRSKDIREMIEKSADPDRTTMNVEAELRGHIVTALPFLAQVLHGYFDHGVYLLIDEYDAPINNTIFKSKANCGKVNDLLNRFFGNLLKKFGSLVERALLTGISYLGSVGLSGVNNIRKHMFLRGDQNGDDRYEEFYGITEAELGQLITKFTTEFWQNTNKLPIEKVSLHYNGYKSIGKSGVEIYPIWSILNALVTGKISDYWETSGIMEGAGKAFKIPIVLLAIEKLILGQGVKCEIPYKLELKHLEDLSDVFLKSGEITRTLEKPDVYLSFLMQQGYLMCVKELENQIVEVKIPNQLIENEFKQMIKSHFGVDYDGLIRKVAEVFDEFPEEPDRVNDDFVVKLITSLQKAFECVSEKWNEANENAYHCVIFHCLCKSRYLSCTEMRGNGGRLDIAFNSDKFAVIIELKYCKDPLDAINQIVKKGYVNSVREKLSKPNFKCVIMGLNVNKKNKVSIAYKNADSSGPPCQVSLQNKD